MLLWVNALPGKVLKINGIQKPRAAKGGARGFRKMLIVRDIAGRAGVCTADTYAWA